MTAEEAARDMMRAVRDAGRQDLDEVRQNSDEARRRERIARLRDAIFQDTLTADEVAEVLGVDRSTIMRWLRDGDLAGWKIGRTWYVEQADVRAFVKQPRKKEKRPMDAERLMGAITVLQLVLEPDDPNEKRYVSDLVERREIERVIEILYQVWGEMVRDG